MWPYDYFNQYSGLMNEFALDIEQVEIGEYRIPKRKTKNIFVAKWYAEGSFKEDKELKREEDKKEKLLIEAIDKIKISNLKVLGDNSGEIENNEISSGLKAQLAKETQKGSINIDILTKIIQATMFVCDITPMNRNELKKIDNKRTNFNANVIAELGLALAWKTPEQVVILLDKKSELQKLPLDIQGYFVKTINWENEKEALIELESVIENRLKELEFTKSIIIKNIKAKLDTHSLYFITGFNGIFFQPQGMVDWGMIRYLLNLGIIATDIFPPTEGKSVLPPHMYFVTDLGRIVLQKGLGITQLYPKVFTEFLHVAQWLGYMGRGFEYRRDKFNAEYNINWDECKDFFRDLFPKDTIARYPQGENVITFFRENCIDQKKSFEEIKKQLVIPWLGKVFKKDDVF